MPLENLIAYPIKGVSAQDRLPITAKLWGDSHDHHIKHRQLHVLSAHRPGIVYGLDVLVSKSDDQSVVVTPGVAIDSNGNTVVLSAPESFTFKERGANYLVIEFQTGRDGDSEVRLGPDELVYANFVEYRRIAVTKEPARGAQIELARVQRSDARAAIKEAANPYDPGSNELSLLYRSLASPHCYVDAAVGEISYVPEGELTAWKLNRPGLVNFLRECAGHGFHLDFIGPYRLTEPDREREPLILYMAGKDAFKELAPEELATIKSLLDRGCFLIGEAKADPFQKSFEALARSLDGTLKELPKDSRLLRGHFLFPRLPSGGNEKGAVKLDPERGILFSSYDFGAAWQGDVGDKGDPRERIRQAIEFGLNIVSFAERRRREIALERLR
jgi:hypothetical protein